MRSGFALLYFFLGLAVLANAQVDEKTAAANKRDSILSAKLSAKGTYPLIKASKFSGVMPVDGVTERPDPGMKYKLLFSFTQGTNDSSKVHRENRGLAEIGRIINLHIAAGVPLENMEIVIVTHGKALFSIFSDEAFRKQFHTDNPNTRIIQELDKAGARFIACGQAMQFLDINKESLPPSVKISVAAKVALSTYQLKGFVLYNIDEP